MPWPSSGDYYEAVQNPRQNFTDDELRSGAPRRTPLGLPRPISGAFGDVYDFTCGQRRYAVKLFTKGSTDQQQRYTAISTHLSMAKLPYTVDFDYRAAGVKIRGVPYPVLKMEWVQGEAINQYVEQHLNTADLNALAHCWAGMVEALGRASIAHGDLQHGNVLVVNGELKLVDYDGMYVPALNGLDSSELGHANYQHPHRTEKDFGLHLDRFSAWVIYASLAALCIDPGLWSSVKDAGDEALLFRKSDFVSPGGSSTLALFAAHPDRRIRDLGGQIKSLCACSDARQVPPLKDSFKLPTVSAVSPAGKSKRTPVVEWPKPVNTPKVSAAPPLPPQIDIVSQWREKAAGAAWGARKALAELRTKFADAARGIRSTLAEIQAASPRLLLLIAGAGAVVFVASYLRSCANTTPSMVAPAGWGAASPGDTPAGQSPVSTGASGAAKEACADMVAIAPPLKATPAVMSQGRGRLGIDFEIVGVHPCDDRLKFQIVIRRNVDRTLDWFSDQPNASHIYLQDGRDRYSLVDLGGVFVQDIVMQPNQAYEGWLEFERPPELGFTLVYSGIEPLPIDLRLPESSQPAPVLE